MKNNAAVHNIMIISCHCAPRTHPARRYSVSTMTWSQAATTTNARSVGRFISCSTGNTAVWQLNANTPRGRARKKAEGVVDTACVMGGTRTGGGEPTLHMAE